MTQLGTLVSLKVALVASLPFISYAKAAAFS